MSKEMGSSALSNAQANRHRSKNSGPFRKRHTRQGRTALAVRPATKCLTVMVVSCSYQPPAPCLYTPLGCHRRPACNLVSRSNTCGLETQTSVQSSDQLPCHTQDHVPWLSLLAFRSVTNDVGASTQIRRIPLTHVDVANRVPRRCRFIYTLTAAWSVVYISRQCTRSVCTMRDR